MRSFFLRFYLCIAILGWVGCRGQNVDPVVPADTALSNNLPPLEVAPDDWPWWRGPQRNNHAQGPLPPLTWSTTQNVLWKTEVPGRGHATPCLWGDAIFISTADEAKESQQLHCYDRQSGKLRWTCELHGAGFMKAHAKNSHASATPACDGEHVFVAYLAVDALWVAALTLEGTIAWRAQAGPFASEHGYGSSPVIYESLVIVAGDNVNQGYITALHRETGKIVWRTARGADPSYGTPILVTTAGRDQLLLSGQRTMVSYNPATGEELWNSLGPAEVTANTVAWNEDFVFASGGYPETGILAIRSDGGGEIAWRSEGKVYVPSPLATRDRLYIVQDNGVAKCLNAETGEEIWSKRLGGAFSASPLLCGDVVFAANEAGVVFVFKAADRYEELARNDLRESIFASPVIAGGRLYLRTDRHLYCIGQPSSKEDRADTH